MKLIILLISISCLQASASVFAQQVTLSEKDVSIQQVFREIRRQTNVDFIFKTNQINRTGPVSIQVRDKPLEEVLNMIFKDQPVDYMLDNQTIIIRDKAVANMPVLALEAELVQQAVQGTVTDVDGNPIAGVSVLEKGTRNGTLTDDQGQFTIAVNEQSAILVVSYLGYVSREIAANQLPPNIALNPSHTDLDEVIVVGYGTQRKVNLTGAVAQVSGEVLENRPVLSVGQALQGMIGNLNIAANTGTGPNAGGAPGANVSFNIRGVTSLSSGSGFSMGSPLYVVDGIQSQDINSINPNDIESITVLKDAASAAIYGSSAPYGVVLITTKQGRKDSKPSINYSTNAGWASYINMPTMISSVEFVDIVNAAQQNTNGTDYFSATSMQRIRDFHDGVITTTTVPNPGRTGGTSWANFDDLGQGTGNDNVDWYDVYFRDRAPRQQHNVSIQGGSNNTNYYVGLGYNHTGGLFKYGTDSYKRYNMRMNVSSAINQYVTANVRSSFTKGINDMPSNIGGGNFFQEITQKWPIIPLKNPDGNFSQQSNVEAYRNGGRNVNDNNQLALTGELVVTPRKGWNITGNYTYNTDNTINESNILSYILYESTGNPYFFPSWNAEELYTRGRSNLSRGRTDNMRHTVNAFTSYEVDVQDHYIKGMVGFAQEYVHGYNLTANSGNITLYTSELPTFETMYFDDNNQAIRETTKQTLTTRGVFGRINYGYKDKYLLELNGRYDGTSRYLSDVRFKFYPGISGAYVISQEDFWQDGSLGQYINFFKLRASYGELGAQSGGYYPFYPSLGTTPATSANWFFNGRRQSSISYPGLVNPDLTWVTNRTVDIGVDFNLFRNRLSAEFDWYSRSSDDIVGPAEQLPAVLGAAAPQMNNAALRTTGFDLTLSWQDRIESIGLQYGIRTVFADSRSHVLKYPNENRLLGTWFDGARIGDIWGYVTDGRYTQAEEDAGIDQNIQGNPIGPGTNWSAGDQKYKDLDGDGLITRGENTFDDPGDRRIIGNSTPRYTYGITLNAAWKGFDVNLFFHGVGKRDAWISTGGVGTFWGTQNSIWQSNFLTIHRDRYTPESPDGYYPKYYLNQGQNSKNQVVQTQYLQDASFMRFKNFQLGYTIPQSVLSRVGIDKLRVYVSGENLSTFTNFVEVIDPEFAGADRGLAYPLQRTWSFGLNLNF